MQTERFTAQNSTGTILTFAQSASKGAIVEYVVYDTNNYQRTGQVMASWDSSGNLVQNEVSTGDLNGSTAGIKLQFSVSGSDLLLRHGITSGTWTGTVTLRLLGFA